MSKIAKILAKEELSHSDIVSMLNAEGSDLNMILEKAKQIKQENVGDKVYMRALLEITNSCSKNCYYCGIRHNNLLIDRYSVTYDEIDAYLEKVVAENIGSIVIQSGELLGNGFIQKIDYLLAKAAELTNGELGITLSCGEQSYETLKRWKALGAQKYLLRIETSNQLLYQKIHPNDENHDFDKRLETLKYLKQLNYHTGTGVMIGMPFQSIENLANDILFMRNLDIDMCGMGPFIIDNDTPMSKYQHLTPSVEKRVSLSLKMYAILRIVMKNINIAATTALFTLDKNAFVKALDTSCNVIMPNFTPPKYKSQYKLYPNKAGTASSIEDSLVNIRNIMELNKFEVGYGQRGDSVHYNKTHLKRVMA